MVVLGCMDGKHVKIVCPPKSGSMYFNYKGDFSTVLLAVCDANYRIIFVDIGSYGHNNDAGIFDRSTLRRAIDDGSLNLPSDSPLPNTEKAFPYFFIGDGAFPLEEHIMKPFPGKDLPLTHRAYNYRYADPCDFVLTF